MGIKYNQNYIHTFEDLKKITNNFFMIQWYCHNNMMFQYSCQASTHLNADILTVTVTTGLANVSTSRLSGILFCFHIFIDYRNICIS